MKENIQETEIKEKPLKLKLKDRLKFNLNKKSSIVVTMFFKNGTSRNFVVKTNSSTFEYDKKQYNIQIQNAKYDLMMRQHHLYYHEGSATPIENKIMTKGDSAYFSVTPETLKPIIKMEYIKTLAKAAEISSILNFIKMMSILTLIGIIGVVVLVWK